MRLRIFQSMEAGDPGAPTTHAAEPVVEALREELAIVTTPVLHTEAHLVLDLPQNQEPVTQTIVQEMEIGGLGAPTAPAAKIAGVAHKENTALVTIPVLHTEVPLALDLQETQDPATHTPAQR